MSGRGGGARGRWGRGRSGGLNVKDGPSDAKEHNFRRGGARWKGGRRKEEGTVARIE